MACLVVDDSTQSQRQTQQQRSTGVWIRPFCLHACSSCQKQIFIQFVYFRKHWFSYPLGNFCDTWAAFSCAVVSTSLLILFRSHTSRCSFHCKSVSQAAAHAPAVMGRSGGTAKPLHMRQATHRYTHQTNSHHGPLYMQACEPAPLAGARRVVLDHTETHVAAGGRIARIAQTGSSCHSWAAWRGQLSLAASHPPYSVRFAALCLAITATN